MKMECGGRARDKTVIVTQHSDVEYARSESCVTNWTHLSFYRKWESSI